MLTFRHGDLLVIEGELKVGTIMDKSNIVLAGNTGHNHRLNSGVFHKFNEEPSLSNSYFLGNIVIKKEGSLTHEEHDTIILPIGTYQCYCQREYDPIEERRVID